MKKSIIRLIAIAVISVCVLGMLAGCNTVEPSDTTTPNENNSNTISFSDTRTFYAEITNINVSHFVVDGLDTNGINHSGDFQFSIDEDTILIWRGTTISIDDFEVGDIVAITYTGSVAEISPAIIENVLRLELAVESQ